MDASTQCTHREQHGERTRKTSMLCIGHTHTRVRCSIARAQDFSESALRDHDVGPYCAGFWAMRVSSLYALAYRPSSGNAFRAPTLKRWRLNFMDTGITFRRSSRALSCIVHVVIQLLALSTCRSAKPPPRPLLPPLAPLCLSLRPHRSYRRRSVALTPPRPHHQNCSTTGYSR